MPTDPPPPTPDEVLLLVATEPREHELSCGPTREPVYPSDLARQLLQTRDAMLDLMAEQNGPPLIRHKAAWEAAMAKCRACLPAPAEAAPEPDVCPQCGSTKRDVCEWRCYSAQDEWHDVDEPREDSDAQP